MRRVLVGTALLWLAGASLASAQSGEETRARELFMEGRAHGEAGEWNQALDSFEGSLELVERTSTMVSVANVLVRLGRGRDALAMLDRFDAIAHPRRDRRHIRAARDLRTRAEEIAANEPVAPEPLPEPVVELDPEPAPEPAPPRDLVGELIVPIIVAGVGVLSFGAMGLFAALRDGAISERDELCPDQVCPDVAARDRAVGLHGDADTWTTATNVAWVSGAVLLAAGVTWGVLVLVLGEPSPDVALIPTLGPGHAGAVVVGRFQ